MNFDIIPKTNKKYFSVTYGCIRLNDSYRFLSDSMVKLVKNLDMDDFNILNKESADNWQFLFKKLAYPYE